MEIKFRDTGWSIIARGVTLLKIFSHLIGQCDHRPAGIFVEGDIERDDFVHLRGTRVMQAGPVKTSPQRPVPRGSLDRRPERPFDEGGPFVDGLIIRIDPGPDQFVTDDDTVGRHRIGETGDRKRIGEERNGRPGQYKIFEHGLQSQFTRTDKSSILLESAFIVERDELCVGSDERI